MFNGSAKTLRQEKTIPTGKSRLTVSIYPLQKRLYAGDTLVLHVEVLNEGPDAVFIPQELEVGCCSLGEVYINVLQGPQIDGPFYASSLEDSMLPQEGAKPPLANQLSARWTILRQGYFYGKELHTYQFRTPGKYLINTKYISRGFSGATIHSYAGELKQLPYREWVGEAESNSIWIEVMKPTKPNKQND